MKRLFALLLTLALLCGCARMENAAASLQITLQNTGTKLTVSGGDATQAETEYWQNTDGEPVTVPLLLADGEPILTLAGITPEQASVYYATPYADGIRLFDENGPIEGVDYHCTEAADGAVQIRFETVYYYYVTIETQAGTDAFVLQCTRKV